MWAYKSYNPNAPDPEEPSDAKGPQAPPSVPRHFSFRSLLGRYREPQERNRLAERFVGLVDPHPPTKHVREDESSHNGRNRRVSFSSQTSGKSGRSGRSHTSSRFSRFLDGASTSKSEVMLAEIMELLVEMKDDIRKAKKRPSDEEISDTSSSSTGSDLGPGQEIADLGKLSGVFSSKSRLRPEPAKTSAEKMSAAAKKAVKAGSKEYAKHKLDQLAGEDHDGPTEEASTIAAVGSLAETLGQDVKPADIIGELPSLGHLGTEGLQELLDAYRGTSEARPSHRVDSESNTAGRPRPHSKPGKSDEKLVSHGNENGKAVDKHDWDMKRPPQAFDWPTQEEIDRENTSEDAGDRLKSGSVVPGSKGTAAAKPSKSDSASRAASFDRPTDRTHVQLPSPGASTTTSDFSAPVDSNDADPAFNIVFPSTPLHQPGEKPSTSVVSKAFPKETKTANPTREKVTKSEQSGQRSQFVNPVPTAMAAQGDQVAALFHQRTSALMQGCLGKCIVAKIIQRSTLTVH